MQIYLIHLLQGEKNILKIIAELLRYFNFSTLPNQ